MPDQRSAFNRRAILAVFFLLLASCAWAQQNLLTNPSFETGNFSGWTLTGNSLNYGVNINGYLIQGTNPQLGPFTVLVHSGTYAGYTLVCDTWCGGSPYGMYVGLSQNVTLVPGNVYTVGFWLGNGSSDIIGDGSLILLNGRQLILTTYPYQLNPGYYNASTTFVATQADNTVTFIISGSGDWIAAFSFDDFSLVQDTLTPGDSAYAYLLQQNNNTVRPYQVNANSGWLIPGNGAAVSTGASPVAVAATGSLAYVADQGSSQVSAYLTNLTSGTMTAVPGSPYAAGLAPSAIAIDTPQHFVYATGLDPNGNGAITGWRYLPAFGGLSRISGSPFPAGTSPAGVAFDRNGTHAYVVDKANNQLLAYSINTQTGALSPLSGSPYTTGVAPSSVIVDSVGNYLYVTDSGDGHISAFRIASDGTLTPLYGSPYPTGTTPIAMTLDSSQRYLYALNSASHNIWGYQINAGNGSLTVVTNSPFTTSSGPATIASASGFVYANTSQGIWTFRINSATGTLTPIAGSPLQFFPTALGTNGTGSGNPPAR